MGPPFDCSCVILFLGNLSLGDLSLGDLSVGHLSLGDLSLGHLSGRPVLGHLSLGHMFLDHLSLGHLSYALLMILASTPVKLKSLQEMVIPCVGHEKMYTQYNRSSTKNNLGPRRLDMAKNFQNTYKSFSKVSSKTSFLNLPPSRGP